MVVIHSDQKKSFSYQVLNFWKAVAVKSRRRYSRKNSIETMLWDPTSAHTRFERLAKNVFDRHKNLV